MLHSFLRYLDDAKNLKNTERTVTLLVGNIWSNFKIYVAKKSPGSEVPGKRPSIAALIHMHCEALRLHLEQKKAAQGKFCLQFLILFKYGNSHIFVILLDKQLKNSLIKSPDTKKQKLDIGVNNNNTPGDHGGVIRPGLPKSPARSSVRSKEPVEPESTINLTNESGSDSDSAASFNNGESGCADMVSDEDDSDAEKAKGFDVVGRHNGNGEFSHVVIAFRNGDPVRFKNKFVELFRLMLKGGEQQAESRFDSHMPDPYASMYKKTKNFYYVHKFNSLNDANLWKSEIVSYLKTAKDSVLKSHFEKCIITS